MLSKILSQAAKQTTQAQKMLRVSQRGFSGFQTEMEKFDFTDTYAPGALGL